MATKDIAYGSSNLTYIWNGLLILIIHYKIKFFSFVLVTNWCFRVQNIENVEMLIECLASRAFLAFLGPYATGFFFNRGTYFRKLCQGDSKSYNVVHGHTFNNRMQQADALLEEKKNDL